MKMHMIIHMKYHGAGRNCCFDAYQDPSYDPYWDPYYDAYDDPYGDPYDVRMPTSTTIIYYIDQ